MMNALQTDKLYTAIRWGLYPFSWCVLLGIACLLLLGIVDAGKAWLINAAILAPLYFVIEWRFPYQRRWAMTWQSFVSDLKYVVVNSSFMAVVSAVLAAFAISLSGDHSGLASTWPLPLQLIVCFLVFEAINYSVHRVMHEGSGTAGRILWRIHVAHHLPHRLYMVMHAVFHPLNSLLIQPLAIILPIWLMGYDQDVVAIFLMVMGMHGLISHFNVDVRMGWMNYVFIGPELHRYHHSADVGEAKNYGAMLSVYDQLFGTFVYRRGVAPADLGVDPSAGLPDYRQTLQVLRLPFSRR